jgi:hypothetical protein
MEQSRILTRDLKLILAAAVAIVKDSAAAERMLRICERTETATEQFMAEQHELRCMRDEHRMYLARAGKEHDERLRTEREVWAREESERRRAVEIAECEVQRRRAAVDLDRERARETRERLARRAHKLGESVAETACEHGPPAGCDPVVEQQPSAA